jgi:hypothetical protein
MHPRPRLNKTCFASVLFLNLAVLAGVALVGCKGEKIEYRVNLLHCASVNPNAAADEIQAVAKRTTEIVEDFFWFLGIASMARMGSIPGRYGQSDS